MDGATAFFAGALNCARQNNRDLSSPSSSGVFILVKGRTFIDADTGTVKNLKKWIVGKPEAWRRAASGKQVSMILGIKFLRLLEPNCDWTQRITLLGCRGPVVKASGWPSFDRQFEPYPRAL